MRKKTFYFLTGVALATCALSAKAANAVASVPEGMITFTLTHGTTSYLSLPLTNNATYTSVVSAVTTNTVSVDDSPAPFATKLATAVAPYFIKFLSGNESGRVMLITANTANSLTLDTTDHNSGAAVALTTTSFNVQVGDTFEVFPGDTLASVFGAGTTQSPLLLTGGKASTAVDTLTLYTTASATPVVYYFNTASGYWTPSLAAAGTWGNPATPANANNTIIYPYSAFTITRWSGNPDTTLVLTGRVTEVAVATKVVSNGTVYTSSHSPTGIKLSQLGFGSNWIKGTSMATADNLGVWNPTLKQFDTYYQMPDATWRKYPDTVTNQSNFAIAAGSVTTIAKHEVVSGAATFLPSTLPYTTY